ncbi:MAG: MFS transporter [Ruminococcaceae bacterium]|nr:MFS transporter [Oscillospiraceae bacterium]
MTKAYTRLKFACYTTNLSMSVVGNLPPLLFLTFHRLYGISYSLLGTLVLINFCTQLIVDLLFSFFSHKFNISLAVKCTPVLTVLGMLLYAAAPLLFPNAVYLGLTLGTVVFSAAAGFCEVLISPIIAAIPAKDPDREMSKLHSIYAWGVVGAVLLGTLFLLLLGGELWQILILLFLPVPLSSALLFFGAELPEMSTPERASGVRRFFKSKGLWLCVFAILLGGAAECTMAQWCSGYLEQALNIPKIWGDIFGVALFAFMLGLGRTLYAKIGTHIHRVLFLGAVGATLCYLTAVLAGIPVLGLAACALTGLCVSMLWPGSLIAASERFPSGGVLLYALMAAGGDMGASIGPQLVGIVTDTVCAAPVAQALAARWAMTPVQLGMKAGMLVGMLFPLLAVFVYFALYRSHKRTQAASKSVEAPSLSNV